MNEEMRKIINKIELFKDIEVPEPNPRRVEQFDKEVYAPLTKILIKHPELAMELVMLPMDQASHMDLPIFMAYQQNRDPKLSEAYRIIERRIKEEG